MVRLTPFLALLSMALLTGLGHPADSVRVEMKNGVPRIVVDGQPVRPRIFWGGPGTKPLKVATEWQEIAFEFIAIHDEPKQATMHLRFGQAAGEILIDDLRVNSIDGKEDVIPTCTFERGQEDFTREWNFWPNGADNTVATVKVVPELGRNHSRALWILLDNPPNGNWPDFHLYHQSTLALRKGQKYRVSFWARANPVRDLTIAFYRPGAPYLFLGGPPNVLESQIRLAQSAGVDIVSFPVNLPWPEPGMKPDWDTVNQQCEMVLKANPKALLLPRIWVGAPPWWCQAHPDSVMKWDDNTPHPVDACVDSPEFLRDSGERLKALVQHLETRFGPSIAGYHPTGQNTGEWFYHDTWNPGLSGYSIATRNAWQVWLKQRYSSDQALKKAWNDPAATLATAEVPSPASRKAAPSGLLRDPRSEQKLIDFAEYQQVAMANCVAHISRVVRQATHGKRLVLAFYGYVHEFGMIPNGPSVSGHYGLRQLLQCPDLDILCSPISYFDRGLGESGPAMTAAESVALAGKMWLVEDDTYTYLGTGTFPGWNVGAKNIEDTNKLLLRNTAQCAMRNFATWWMDLGSSGWFDDPRMWEVMRQLKAVDQSFLQNPKPYQPEVAVVVDEASMFRVASGGNAVTQGCIYEIRGPLGRMGAPYGQYLLDDVLAGGVRAKLFVFANAWSLSPEQRRALIQATAGSVSVWCYAPGYLEPTGPSLSGMRELTGFPLERLQGVKAMAMPTSRGRQLGLNQSWGKDQVIQPLFSPMDVNPLEILATYPNGKPSITWKEASTGREGGPGGQLFVGVPGVTTELLRFAAKRAGVNLFTNKDCQVYANGRYVVLHAAATGPIDLETREQTSITDVIANQVLGKGPKVTVHLNKGDTRIFLLGDPDPGR